MPRVGLTGAGMARTMKMRLRSVVFAASLALGLMGCSSPMLTQPGSPSVKISSLYGYGAADRDLKLIVRGTPFSDLTEEQFAKEVEIETQGVGMRTPTRLTLTPGPAAKPNYSVVFVFQPTVTLTGQNLCDGHFDQGPGSDGILGGNGFVSEQPGVTVRAIAAFCVSGRAETEIVGQTQAVNAADVRVLDLVRAMAQALFRPDLRDGIHHGGIEF